MIHYNDFPTLSEKQYKDLNNAYKTITNQKEVSNLASLLLTSKTSLLLFTNANPNIRICLKRNEEKLSNIIDSLFLLYPKTNSQTNAVDSNLFSIMNQLTQATMRINNLIKNENKSFYKKLLLKMSNLLTETLSDILNCLSKQKIRLFSHF